MIRFSVLREIEREIDWRGNFIKTGYKQILTKCDIIILKSTGQNDDDQINHF